MRHKALVGFLVAALVLGCAMLCAAGMESENYVIPRSVQSGGGAFMVSENYVASATLGQGSGIGPSSSANYAVQTGFWISFAIGSFKDELVVNFVPAYGLYQYDQAGGWKQWNSVNPSQMVTVDLNGDGTHELVAAFQGYGLYTYDSTNGWQLINTVIPEFMGAGRNNRIACDYGAAYGLWLWDLAVGWRQINSVDPEKMIVADIDGDGQDELVVSFVGYGLYSYDVPGVWTPINTLVPDAMVPYSNRVVCDYGVAYGLWSYSKTGGWVQRNTVDPGQMTVVDIDNDGVEELVVSFSGYGLYYLDETIGWQLLNSVVPVGMKPINFYPNNDLLVGMGRPPHACSPLPIHAIGRICEVICGPLPPYSIDFSAKS